ncbi:hypothetical protein F5877DRAFT_12209, partial [Lentinula edodes]
KLSEYDLAICRTFSYKLQSHTTDGNFRKLPYAFPMATPLPSLDKICSRIAFLSSVEPEIYHCCINSCICYTGSHESRETCPFCNEPRYNSNKKAQKRFIYIPVIPRLKAFAMNPEVAKNMQYLNNFTNGSSEVRTTKDVFDGEDYKFLRKQNVVVGSRTYTYHHFNDHQDIALGLSTDGFGPFKRRKHTC